MRIAFLLSCLGFGLLLGCDDGVLTPLDQADAPNLVVDAGDGVDAAPLVCDPPGTLPAPGDGHHNPGQPCMACHGTAQGSVAAFTVAGTVYGDLAGSAPVAQATIHLVDASGREVTVVSAINGNFWSTAPVTYPVRTWASRCPDAAPMLAEVAASGASCNTCHGGGNRIHLP